MRAHPIEKPEAVRIAGPGDENAIYDCLIELHRTGSVARRIPYRPEMIFAQIRVATRPNDPDNKWPGLIGVIDDPEKEGCVVGTIGLFLQQWWHSDQPILDGKWIFVRPDSRAGAKHFDELFTFAAWARWKMDTDARAAAERQGNPYYPLVCELSHISGDKIEAKDRIFGRYGRRVGSIFMLGLDD